MGAPNLVAFRAFLLDQKTCVTRVTCVTAYEINDLTGYADGDELVTRVTAPACDQDEAEAQVLERQAIAEIDGGIPPVYSHAFARLQIVRPPGLDDMRWGQMIDDAAVFLDVFGREAERLRWTSDNLFGPGGLLATLNGRAVASLSSRNAILIPDAAYTRRPA